MAVSAIGCLRRVLLLAGCFFCIVDSVSPWIGSATSKFGSALVRQLADEKPRENIVVSPISIQGCMSLLYPGSGGATMKEMQQVLHFPSNMSRDQVYLGLSGARWPEYDGGNDGKYTPTRPLLSVAYSLYIDNSSGPVLSEHYRDLMSNRVVLADLGSLATATAINKWASKETHGKIPGIVPVPLPSGTKLVALNTVYLKAQWLHQFSKFATHTGKFLTARGSVAVPEVDYMTMTKEFLYYKTATHQVAYIPLRGGLEVAVGIPFCWVGDDAEEMVDAVELIRLRGLAKSTELALMMPKFKIDVSYNPLNKALKELGIREAFGFAANFSALGHQQLHIDEVIHKTHIGFDEHGVEAAAATAIMMREMAIMKKFKVPVLLQLSQPFYFSIYDTASSVVFFQGKIEKPSGSDQGRRVDKSFELNDTSRVFYGPIHREVCPSALSASVSSASVNFTIESVIGKSVTLSCLGICFMMVASTLYMWRRYEIGIRPSSDGYVHLIA